MATKKRTKKTPPPYLNLITGGKDLTPAKKAWITRKAEKLAQDKDVQVLAIDRPLIAIVSPEQLDSKKGISAKTYLDAAEQRDGRTRNVPELNVLNSAKYWYRDMIRFARSEGYTDMKKFFKEGTFTNASDKKLFDAIATFIEMENRSKSNGPG